jgi:DTW domain-containing protein YfiP
MPLLETRTRLVLVIHRYEDRKPTNTGRLAASCLAGSRVIVRGHEDAADRGDTLQASVGSGTVPLLLFPHDDARDLRDVVAAHAGAAFTLIVPDGTWRQASKVRQRVRGLEGVPSVTLPSRPREPSRYRLRTESRDGGLATMEAIARAFGILESPEVETALLRVFACMVERTLWARGEIDASAVTGGVPVGAERHDPSSGALPCR